jgi:vacuolar-type H+-ATPase subunit H
MGLDDIVNKAKDVAEDIADKAKDAGIDLHEKAEEALHSEQAEKISDAVLDAGEKAANTMTGGKFADQVGDVRDDLDAKVGTDGAAGAGA